MTSTPTLRPSRPQTPSSIPGRDPREAPTFRAPSAPPLQARLTPLRTVSQATITTVPPRIHGSNTMSRAPSPGSSVINLDMNEGILVRDADIEDAEVAETDEQIEGVFAESSADGEERKKQLRDQLRKTLKREDTNLSRIQGSGKQEDAIREGLEEAFLPKRLGGNFPQRQYFVFTNAGKPVFISRPSEATEDVTSFAGIASALVSVFADTTLSPTSLPSGSTDKLRCINAGNTRITFFLRSPLCYVCVSKWGEPESVARMHLEYLHLQILSVLTAGQLKRIFERRTNFDLGRLLEGTESFMHTLIDRLQNTIALFTTLSSLSSLRLDSNLRSRLGDGLVPKAGALDILYAILVYGDSIITIVRPKRHSVHPSDLYVLLNAVNTSSVSTNQASWLPICLPKFNSQGFVHAYVSYLDHDDSLGSSKPAGKPSSSYAQAVPSNSQSPSQGSSSPPDTESLAGVNAIVPETGGNPRQLSGSQSSQRSSVYEGHPTPSVHHIRRNGLALITVSGGGEFDAVRRWSDAAVKKLETTGLVSQLQTAVKTSRYSSSELGIPGLRHFIYKSRVHVQATSPVWDDEYQNDEDQKRLITLYQILHDAIHAKSGQAGPLRLQYIRTEKEAVLGWITQPFELYIVLSAKLPKTAAVGAANAVARWAKREESRLFLRDAPVF